MGGASGADINTKRTYLPYGEHLEAAGDDDMPYQFTGKELDNNAAGLYYFGARYYMPGIGRWLVRDPADQYHSRYVYAGNNPVNVVDLDGKVGVDLVDHDYEIWGRQIETENPHGLWPDEEVGPPLIIIPEHQRPNFIGRDGGVVSIPKIGFLIYTGPKAVVIGGAVLVAAYMVNDIATNLTAEATNVSSPGSMQKQVEKGPAPKSVDRVDQGRGQNEKDHVHFKDGSALNKDGSWKHGKRKITKKEA